MILKARFVVPVDGPALTNGAVVVEGGQITEVVSARRLHGHPTIDYGDAVICPGFVNAHTHLDLSLLAGRLPPSPDFVDWLTRLMALLTEAPLNRESIEQAVRTGITQSLSAGVTLVGDITRTPAWTRSILSQSALQAVSFGEVIAIGTRRTLLAERLEAAASPAGCTRRIRAAIAPHAPYTVEPAAMEECARRARCDNLPLCVHVAETADEELFTRNAAGPLADYLRRLSVWNDQVRPSGCTPVELVDRTGLLGPNTLLAHVNYVNDADIRRISRRGASVVYCPRTHSAFAHAPHRFPDMLAAGVNVCLGTDSLASCPTLSMLDELRFLRRIRPQISPPDLLKLATLAEARALGCENIAGSLGRGKNADLVVIPLPSSTPIAGWEVILDSTEAPSAVYIQGTPVRPVLEPQAAL